MSDTLNFQEVCERLKIEPPQLKELISKGKIKALSEGGTFVFKEDVVASYESTLSEPTILLDGDTASQAAASADDDIEIHDLGVSDITFDDIDDDQTGIESVPDAAAPASATASKSDDLDLDDIDLDDIDLGEDVLSEEESQVEPVAQANTETIGDDVDLDNLDLENIDLDDLDLGQDGGGLDDLATETDHLATMSVDPTDGIADDDFSVDSGDQNTITLDESDADADLTMGLDDETMATSEATQEFDIAGEDPDVGTETLSDFGETMDMDSDFSGEAAVTAPPPVAKLKLKEEKDVLMTVVVGLTFTIMLYGTLILVAAQSKVRPSYAYQWNMLKIDDAEYTKRYKRSLDFKDDIQPPGR